MSLNKPEINYDTALYALQENVILKQRLEEDKQQYINRLEGEEKRYADLLFGMQNLRYLESITEEKLDKALDDVRCLSSSLDIRTKQRDKALGKTFAAMVLAVISFCLTLYVVFNYYTWSY